MSRLFWVALLVCVAWLVVGTVFAQEAPPGPTGMAIGAAHSTPSEVVVVSPHADTDGPAPEEAVFSANLMLGYLTGVRAEFAFLREENHSYAVEGFYGAVLTRMGVSEGAGGGVRAFFRKTSRYSTNSLLLGPGLDVLAQFNNDRLVIVAPTVDLSWLHGFAGGAGWETGINVGLGIGVASDRKDRFGFDVENKVGKVTPLISFYTGVRW
jgi:hypothetical protein